MIAGSLLVVALLIVLLNAITALFKYFQLHLTKNQHKFSSNDLSLVQWIVYLTYKINSKLPFVRDTNATIAEIIVYPIKSFPGLSVTSWTITEYGLDCDRMYMLGQFDPAKEKYKAITLREFPQLSLVKLRLEDERFIVQYKDVDYFSLPRSVSTKYLNEMSDLFDNNVELWGIEFQSLVLSKLPIQQFLSDLNLPSDLKLLYSCNGKLVRTNSPENLTEKKGFVPGSHPEYRVTKFQDYYPILLMSYADIQDVNKHISEKFGSSDSVPTVSTANFRPNIVLDGVKKPYDIDEWYRFKINKDKEWIVTSKCPRCSIPNIDPQTGLLDKLSRVSKTLAKYRRVDLGNLNLAFLGVCAVQVQHGYNISVGQDVQLLERKLNRYINIE